MLAEISGRFVQARPGEVDAAIHAALATVSRFAEVERAHVYTFDEDYATMIEVARWPAPGGAPEWFSAVLRDDLPFYSEEIFSNRVVAISEVGEIPESAPRDREFVARMGVRSAVTVPLTNAGETVGVMTVATLSHPRSWNDEEIAMLRVAADIIAPALVRRRLEAEQQESLAFGRLITSLLSEYVNLPAEELDDGLQRALETIARFVSCDRCAIYILDESEDFADLYRGWWASGAAPVVADFYRIRIDPLSPTGAFYGAWIHSDEPNLVFNAPTIEEIRPDATEAIRRNRLGTVANFPLAIGDRRIGWFGIGAGMPRVSWSEAELRSLGIAAEALANMYARLQSEQERRHHARFEETLSELAADFIKRPLAGIRTGIKEIVDRFGRFAGSDRAAVLLIDDKEGTASTYHEWIARGEPAPVRDFPVAAAPWFYGQLMAAKGPWLMYVEEFPPSDALAKEALQSIGIRTILNCPIADGEQVYGYASIGYPKAYHRPPAGTEQVLAFAAGIIANALSRERLERQALEHQEALARALRLGSLGQLATGIAHELNQPLTAIANYGRAGVRWLATDDYERQDVMKILDRVSEEAIRAGEIIHKLRSHLKGGPRRRRASSIREIVENACSLLAGTARDREVTIRSKYVGSLPFVHAEATEIEQVVINIVQNSIDSIVAAQSETREIVIKVSRNRAFVEVEISDQGPGFGAAGPVKAFDQFYTTKPGGLGLGLSISRALIESNGGSITAESSPSGAVVRFALPVAGAAPSAAAAS